MMNRKILQISLIFMLTVAFAGETVGEIVALDGFIGVGMRATAMGGAHIGLAQDHTAAYYNPALLSLVYKNEIGGVLTIRTGKSKGTLNSGAERSSSFTEVKLGDLGGVLSAKAKKGGVAFAAGFYRYQSFDYSVEFAGNRSDGLSLEGLETSDGGIGALYLSMGGQLAKYVSFGGTFEVIMGGQNLTWDATISNLNDTLIADTVISDNYTYGYSGVTGRVGFAVTPTKYLTWGGVIKFPSAISIHEELTQDTEINYLDGSSVCDYAGPFDDDISLTTPFRFGTGIGVKTPIVNLAADMIYSNWGQANYNDPPDSVDNNPRIPDSYRDVLSFGAGLEFTIPIKFLPTRIRGGYRYDPLPYAVANTDKERQAFTGGIAFLLDKNFLLEASAVMSNWKSSYTTDIGNEISEEYSLTDIYVGMAYRF